MESESPSARWRTFRIIGTSRELGRSADCPAFHEGYRQRERTDAEETKESLFLSPGGIMDDLTQLANLGLTLVGFGLPFITIYLLYRLVRNTERPSSGSNPWPTAIELLDDRFARGEISEEEYRARKRLLIEEDLQRRAQL
jgi:Short C-terminal domain